MKELSCEDVLMAQMAAADGEELELSKEHLEKHIARCANCQHELKQMHDLDRMLAGHTLSESRVDLWPSIENRIAGRTRYAIGWQPFALIGLLLVICKLVEMLPTRDLGMAFKLVPLVIVTLLFILIRENPFRINTELVLER
jgi:predicted anti-sigma-YlaC factor YlaD